MKKSWKMQSFKLVYLLLSLILVLVACSDNKSNVNKQSEVIELNINNVGPSVGVYAKEMFEPWKELVEEKTNGRVLVNIYHGGVLGNTASLLKDVKGGIYEVGLAWTPNLVDSELFPLTMTDLPFAATIDVGFNDDIFNKFAQPYMEEIQKDVVVMGFMAGIPNFMFTKSPVNSVQELKNKKIRVAGENEVEMVKAIGGIPVSVTSSELYDSLQKGILEVSVTSIDSTIDRKLYEVSPYLIDFPFRSVNMVALMNKNFYNSLPDDLKELFDNELNPALKKLVLESNIKSMESSKNKFLEIVGNNGGITQFSEEDVEFVRNQAKVVWDNWVKIANDRGLNGEKMKNEYKALMKEAGIELPY